MGSTQKTIGFCMMVMALLTLLVRNPVRAFSPVMGKVTLKQPNAFRIQRGLLTSHNRCYDVWSGVLCFSTRSPTELDELNERIKIKGDEIRKLKSDGIDKAALAPHIEELMALKAQLPQQDTSATKQSTKNATAPTTPTAMKGNSEQGRKQAVVEESSLSESELRLNRLSKVEAIRAAGIEPFEYTFQTTHSSSQLLAQYDGKLEPGEEDETANVSVAGRIMIRRLFGKLAFFAVQDERGTIQLQFDKSRLGETFDVSGGKVVVL